MIFVKRVTIGSDHSGFALKEEIKKMLSESGWHVFDAGCFSEESVDYPRIAAKACDIVLKERIPGILICGTGTGMSIAANKIPGIRAALCHDKYTAKMSREHNNANILCLGGRILDPGSAKGIVSEWLSAGFSGGRHFRRVSQISALDGIIRVHPSILAADRSALKKEIESVATADMIHVDVMDGVFVENRAFEDIPELGMPLDAHIMANDPMPYIQKALLRKAALITFHIESDVSVEDAINLIHSSGAMCGIALNPQTPAESVYPYLDMTDVVLVMSVELGKSGQEFMESALEKIRALRERMESAPVSIAVDGGINDKTAKKAIDVGATMLVSGSFVFSSGDREMAIRKLKTK
ncbi:MAG: ribose 5-phosphate isomerase B [Candidatus Micrarchaeota archaeon]|nr:ribose 5-phosphate isomerase B [Candidatus Micrarchaeota archaeon]